MSKRKKVQLAKVQIGKETIEFNTLGQATLDAANKAYETHFKGNKLYHAKVQIGEVIDAIQDDMTDPQKIKALRESLFPALTNQEWSNYRKLYSLTEDPEFDIYRKHSHPKCNSETHLIQSWRFRSNAIATFESDQYKEFSQEEVNIKKRKDIEKALSDYETWRAEQKRQVKENQESESREGQAQSGVKTMTAEEAVERFGFLCNQLITINNLEKSLRFTQEQKDEIFKQLNNVHGVLFAEKKADLKLAVNQ